MESDLARKYVYFLNVSSVVCFVCCLVVKSCPAVLQPRGPYPIRLLCPWDFPGKNIGGYSALEQMKVNLILLLLILMVNITTFNAMGVIQFLRLC